MLGSYIVYEGTFTNRLRVREIVGDTGMYWKVRCSKYLDTTRIKKTAVGPHAFFNSEREAQKVANRYTEKLIKASKRFTERRAAIFAELRSHNQETAQND